MTIIKRLLQSVAAVAVVAVPLLAAGQTYPTPAGAPPTGAYTNGYPYVSTAYPIAYQSEAWRRVVGGTPLDPNATTVQVVPPQGGTVMLYRNGSMKGWWLSPSAITVRPGQVYGVVATRGSSVLFNAAMVFRPGVTSLAWSGDRSPRIAYSPAWNYNPYGHGYAQGYGSGYGHGPEYGVSHGRRHVAQPSSSADRAASAPRAADYRTASTRPASSVKAARLPSPGIALSPAAVRQHLTKVRARRAAVEPRARVRQPARTTSPPSKANVRSHQRRVPRANVAKTKRSSSRAVKARPAASKSVSKRRSKPGLNFPKAWRARQRAPQG